MMHLIRHRKIINSKIFIVLLVTLIWLIADTMLEFVFPTYLEGIGKSFFEIGILLSLASIAGLLIDLPMGSLSDRVSRKKLMITGLLLSVIASFIVFSFAGDLVLALAFFFWGFAFQFWKVPRDACFACLTKKKHRGAEYGLDEEVKAIGATIGPIIGGFVLMYFGFTGILNTYAVMLIIASIILFLFIKETNRRSISKEMLSSYKQSSLVSDLKEFKIFGLFGAMLLLISMMFTMMEGIIITFVPLFYGPDALNLTPDMGGLLLACFSLPGIFLSFPAGKVADKIGKKRLLFIGLIIIGLSSMLFSISTDLPLIFAFALIMSAGWGFAIVSLNSLIIDLTYKHSKGRAMGSLNFFTDIGYIAGPFVGGVIAELSGIRNVFLIIGVIFIASSTLIFLFSGGPEISQKEIAIKTKLWRT